MTIAIILDLEIGKNRKEYDEGKIHGPILYSKVFIKFYKYLQSKEILKPMSDLTFRSNILVVNFLCTF